MSPVWRRVGWSALGLAVLAAAIGGWWYWQDGRFRQETNDATLQADQVAVSAKLAGNVTAVAVDDNQPVTGGQLLVTIDPGDVRIRLSAAEAGIATARAGAEAVAATLSEAKASVLAAEAERAAAQSALDQATREVARYRPLVRKGAEAAQKLARLTTEQDQAEANLKARQAALNASKERVESLGAQAAEAAARVRSAEIQQQSAARDLADTRVAAPVAGRVASRAVRVGQYVQPGTRLLTIVPSTDLYVIANFKETQVGLMRPGQPAVVRVDALPGVTFSGRVASVTPGTGAQFSLIPPQNATGNFTKIVQRVPVKIALSAGPAARKVLSPGMSVTVEVDTRAAKAELDAIRAEQNQQ
ncbi:MAG: HlyD family secretion protein [Sphingomonadales bacterium]|nr:HlyD family secretion protein [Sphingomonadales bacterium]